MSHEAIHFGAGNIGRGFIGPILMDSGYKVTFADVVAPLIDNINSRDCYDLHILSAHGNKAINYKKEQYLGINSTSEEGKKELFKKFETASIVTTSVGPNILKFVAPNIAAGLKQRKAKDINTPINVIACENLVGGTALLKAETMKHIPNEDDVEWVNKHVGFPNAAVDRIVPIMKPNAEKPLDVQVEEFSEWDVEAQNFKGPDPNIKGLIITHDLDAYVERKLFTVNTSHCVIAYLGYLKGKNYIHEAIADPEIYEVTKGAVTESGAALVSRHSKDFTKESHQKYIDIILEERMKNDNLVDEVFRVGRCPKRKLARNDRLVGPAAIAMEHGLPTDNLAKGMAAALLFDYPEDEEAPAVQKLIADNGVEKAFIQLSGLSVDKKSEKDLIDEVVRYYGEMKSKYKK